MWISDLCVPVHGGRLEIRIRMGFVVAGKKIYLDKEWLHERYCVDGLSLRAIADIVGCGVYVIHNRMDELGIPRRNSWPKKDTLYTNRDWLYEMFVNNGMLIGTMANLAQCGRSTISKWLRRYDIIKGDRYKWKADYKHNVICEECGKEFAASPSRNRRFCSRKCSGLFHRERIEIECLQCGRKVVIRKREVENGYGKFCSRDCCSEWSIGENSSNWRGGLSFEPYSLNFNKAFKKKVRQRDLYKCAVCGNRALSVHHIDYDKQHTTFGNCITLCRSHHSKTNFNRNFWMTILLPLAIRRTEAMEGLNA